MNIGFSLEPGINYGPVEETTGLLIFAETDSIPQDVIFIPVKDTSGKSVEDILFAELTGKNNSAIILYFQGLRWSHPQLAKDLQTCKQTSGVLTDQILYYRKTKVQIVLGTILFNRTKRPDVGNYNKGEVQLQTDERNYNFTVRDAPADVGYPIRFKKS